MQCAGSDCAMLFGSTGAGKSTLLHLLAGARFTREAVEIGGDDDDEFGSDIDMQLVADMQIPGCAIGNTASSTTMLLNSYVDSNTGLTIVDTPGFGNVGDDDDEDTTVDAANSAAIMRTIRSCGTLRIVFLISVKDQLNTTRGGQIKSLFSVLEKFIQDASMRLSSVFMLFTHCDGFPSASKGTLSPPLWGGTHHYTRRLIFLNLLCGLKRDTKVCKCKAATLTFAASTVIPLLKNIGRSKVLPENLLPFLRHAIKLLETHGDDLLVRPADDEGQQRIEAVRRLLKNNVEGLQDTGAVLQCPLSDEVGLIWLTWNPSEYVTALTEDPAVRKNPTDTNLCRCDGRSSSHAPWKRRRS